ncbi:hypothetical protein BJ742DRAFT_872650, partial [Cladochytrium replicatum]
FVALVSLLAGVDAAVARTPAGRLETRQGSNCVVAGCSGEFCRDATEASLATLCEWRSEFKCFHKHHDACERLPTGKCGWKPAVKACVESVKAGGPII